ncbi:MAG: DUF1294 domain-containing protein [Bacilli bacterium]|nr:DUF1294 domain-containing protein [Bacilli bacterium]
MNPILILVIINIISFITMGWDKYKAIKNKWRISEYTLFSLCLMGGSIGILLGMIIFHHKTKKNSFRILVPIFLIINIIYVLLLK